MGKKKSTTVGYKYYLGVHFVLCHGPVDELTRITVDDRTAWTGNVTSGTATINNDKLFGGEKREGGISGTFSFLPGSATQGQDSYLLAQLGSGVPAYRRVASVVLRQMYMGTNPYLKKWSFRIKRIMLRSDGTAQWYSAKVAIGQDMNPAHIIYECLTDRDWGLGYTSGDVDVDSFTAAADKLYNESFGLSILWEKEASIEDFITDILRHIDGSLYVDKSTGKFTLNLVRDDYVVSGLKLVNESNVVDVEEFKCATNDELFNTVTLNYWDSATSRTASLTVQDIALVQIQGAVVSRTVEYGGITKADLASKVASRDLKALSSPVTTCKVIASRALAGVKPGEAVKFSWDDYGVSNMVMRVGGIEYGEATDNKLVLTLIQDVFSLGTATYAPPPATEWVSPVSSPQAVTNRLFFEAPYYMMVRSVGEDEVNDRLAAAPSAGYVAAAGKAPTSDAFGAQLWVDSGAGYIEESLMDFCPYGVLSASVAPMATTFTLSSSDNFYSDTLSAGDYAVIDSEIVEVTGYTDTSLTVTRGHLDTVPASHAAGAKVYVLSTYFALSQTEFLSGEAVTAKLLTQTGKGVLDIGSAPTSSVTMASRAIRPYPPGQWAIAGNYFPVQLLDTPVTTTWAHRNRLQQTGSTLVDFTEASVGPEAGTTYSIRLYNHDTSVLLHSVDGLSGVSYSGFPSPSGHFNMRMELWSARDGYSSTYKQSHVFDYFNVTYLNDESLNRLVTEDGAFQLTTE